MVVLMLSEKDIEKILSMDKISENEMFEKIKENNFEYDCRYAIFNHKTFLVFDTFNNYIEYDDTISKANQFVKKLSQLKFERLPIKDYSNSNIHISYSICNEKCVYEFGNSEKCLECEYYKDCMCEIEIDNFERQQEKKLNDYLNKLENEEFPL